MSEQEKTNVKDEDKGRPVAIKARMQLTGQKIFDEMYTHNQSKT